MFLTKNDKIINTCSISNRISTKQQKLKTKTENSTATEIFSRDSMKDALIFHLWHGMSCSKLDSHGS
jgi:hypothetical protein